MRLCCLWWRQAAASLTNGRGLIPAGCWNSMQCLGHFLWHRASHWTDRTTFVLLHTLFSSSWISSVTILRWQCLAHNMWSIQIFPLNWQDRKHFVQFLVLKMKDFRNFVLHNVYLKLQVTNLKNKEVTANPKPQTLKTKRFSKALYPKP